VGFGVPNASGTSSYDNMYLSDSSSTLPSASYPQAEPFYQDHVTPGYFTANHSEPQQIVM